MHRKNYTTCILGESVNTLKNIGKSDYDFSDSVLAVFAKEPRIGQVKTRMEPELGIEGALNLHKSLIRYVFCSLSQAGLCPVELWVASADDDLNGNVILDKVFVSICNKERINKQIAGDLGLKMQHAAGAVLSRADSVILVGADCPAVDATYLRQALELLAAGEPIVIGPADDGGYVLLGLRHVPDCLFSGVPWGTDRVLEVTREQLRRSGERWVELEPRWDVDRPEDLKRLASLNPPFPKF